MLQLLKDVRFLIFKMSEHHSLCLTCCQQLSALFLNKKSVGLYCRTNSIKKPKTRGFKPNIHGGDEGN